MNFEEKFYIASELENKGITFSELENLQMAIYMKDQDRINSDFQYLLSDIEKIGITPSNLKSVLRWLYNF